MESSAAIKISNHNVLSFGIILDIGSSCGFPAQKIKAPDIVPFLLAGIELVLALSGVLDSKADSSLTLIMLICGFCSILFGGGASVRFKVLNKVWITILLISPICAFIAAGATAASAFHIFEVLFIAILLLGAPIASPGRAACRIQSLLWTASGG